MSDLTNFTTVKEGQAAILFPKENKVFYNPIQQFNRDLSVTCIRAWSELYLARIQDKKQKRQFKKGLKRNVEGELQTDPDSTDKSETPPFINIIEALSASGLRAIRYAKEIPKVRSVLANDFSPSAVESIKRNVEFNEVSSLVKPNHGDAIKLMSSLRDTNQYHVIDLDPYGTAAPFMDSAIQAIKDEGLLLVTCTDLGVLAGNGYPEKCFGLYGGTNASGDATHEVALRLVLHMIANIAGKYGKTIEPQLSLSVDFYVRLFIKVKKSPITVKSLGANTMINYVCSGCGTSHAQHLMKMTLNEKHKDNPLCKYKYSLAQGPGIGTHCSFCSSVFHLTGPMWGGSLHNKEFMEQVLQVAGVLDPEVYRTIPRIKGMTTLALQELDAHFYFKPTTMASVLRCQPPPLNEIASALGNLGFKASLTHAMPNGIKTNADWESVWFLMKKWCEKYPVKIEKMSHTAPGFKILTNDNIAKGLDVCVGEEKDEKVFKNAKEVSYEELFRPNEETSRMKLLRSDKIVRFQQNPEKNWGPKARPDSKK